MLLDHEINHIVMLTRPLQDPELSSECGTIHRWLSTQGSRHCRNCNNLDMRMGFWHEEMDPKSRQYTTLTVGPLGYYECKCMPFGLTNAPATFQRMMESCLGDLHLNCCLIYLDDVVVHSKMEEEHLISL